MPWPDYNWLQAADHVVHLFVAYLLALPIGWEREYSARGAGLRTFPLVAMASCGYLLLAVEVLEGSQAYARVLYGLMTGIGFIGGGAILKHHGNITGTASAAAIWTTGAIGAAVAWRRYDIALALSLITFITLRTFSPFKRDDDDDDARTRKHD